MKLLFDQSLSHNLVAPLLDLFPDSDHVRNYGLGAADDQLIWDFATRGGFAIVSKDEDFHQRSFLYGFPPKVIWVKIGNCSTQRILDLLRDRAEAIEAFQADAEAAFLTLR